MLRRNPIQERAEIMYPAQCSKCKQRGKTPADIWHAPPCVPYRWVRRGR